MEHFKTIAGYCEAINIAPPQQAFFDIKRFEENMATVVAKKEPFKHEFYAIAIKVEGSGKAISGHYKDFPEGATIFFNIPFQIISWDILPDWEGYYLMFTKEFITKSKYLQKLLTDFPFLKIDQSRHFTVKPDEVSKLLTIFESTHEENKNLKKDSLQLIESQILVLLNFIKRFFTLQIDHKEAETAFKTIISQEPEFGQTYYSYALLLSEENRIEEAIEQMQQAIKYVPDNIRFYYNLSLLYDKVNDFKNAETTVVKGLKLAPQNGELLYVLAYIYQKSGQVAKARNIAQQLVQLYPNNQQYLAMFNQLR